MKIWLVLWAAALSLAWLVPNHFPPWSTFHGDMWMATVAWLGCGWVVMRNKAPLELSGWVVLPFALACVSWLQLFGGLLHFIGQAWMSSIYLAGFGLALLTGERWERSAPGQLASALFIAIAIGTMLSVGLQLLTWLQLNSDEVTDIWSMGLAGNRPYANIGQPNLLASFLLWGVLAALWAYQFRVLGGWVAGLMVFFLMVGLALTQSRTGYLSLSLLLLATWYWRSLWRSPYVPVVATALFTVFWLIPPLLTQTYAFLFFGPDDSYLRALEANNLRLSAWVMFWDAAWQRPWFGYGFTEVAAAQVGVADRFAPMAELFGHSHNLFLDFVLWFGLPMGLAISVTLIYWFWVTFRSTADSKSAILLLLIMVMAVHAMLELPLHHAFFLIPTGFIMGILNAHRSHRVLFSAPAVNLVLIWVALGAALFITTRDYLRIEEGHTSLRFEKARIGLEKTGVGAPPEVLVLTQLKTWIWGERYEPKSQTSSDELENLDALTRRYPTGPAIYRLAKAYALNDQPEKAQYWLLRLCKFTNSNNCKFFQAAWSNDAKVYGSMAKVTWP